MNGKKLLKERLGVLLILLIVVAVGAAVSFGIKKGNRRMTTRRFRLGLRRTRPPGTVPEIPMKIRNPRRKRIRLRQFT